jgi:hypothetical protein
MLKTLRDPNRFLILVFLGIIAGLPLSQALLEARRGERPQALDVFQKTPTAVNLRAFEHRLDEASWAPDLLRPWVQFAQLEWLRDGGRKALAGRDGWFFYRPGFDAMLNRPQTLPATGGATDPLPAILAFRDDLAARGITLVVMAAPNKESVYPDQLTRRAHGWGVVRSPQMESLLKRLEAANVECIDLLRTFSQARRSGQPGLPLYLAQDSHWSPAGVGLAARETAARLGERGWVKPGRILYGEKPAPVSRIGDVVRMMQAPPIERRCVPETVPCVQVIREGDGQPYKDDPGSEIFVLGDSFLRIYEQDEPGSAGFVAHLAKELKQPLTSLVSDGGASTLVRQELHRRPGLLRNKKIVLWEFVERDILMGAEGWQVIRMPKNH